MWWITGEGCPLFYSKNITSQSPVMLVGRLLMTIAIFWWRTTKIITTTSMFAGDTRKNSTNNNSTIYSLGFLSGMSVLHWRVIWPVYTARRRMILSSICSSQIVRVPTMDLPGWAPVASDLFVSGMMERHGTLRTGNQVCNIFLVWLIPTEAVS